MIKVSYTEREGPAGRLCRMEATGHAGYAPAGQDIVCAGASTLMQALLYLLAGQEGIRIDASDEPHLCVSAAPPQEAWVDGTFELAKAGFALLAERYPDHVRFVDHSARGAGGMVDLQLFAEAGGEGGEAANAPAAAPPALSRAQQQQAVASGTLRPGEAAQPPTPQARPAPEPAPEAPPEARPPQPPRPPALPPQAQNAVRGLHARWAAEEAALRRSVPGFSFQQELKNPEMRRLMQLPGMRMQDAYRLAHYTEQLRRTAQAVEQGVVERIRQRAARPAENGAHPSGAAVTHADVAHMTRAQREALEREALHGAKIQF